jgi:hypothetical protein
MALAKLFSLDVKGRTYEKSHVVCSEVEGILYLLLLYVLPETKVTSNKSYIYFLHTR